MKSNIEDPLGWLIFVLENEKPHPILYIDDSVAGEQIEMLNAVRAKRDQKAVDATLGALRKAATDESANTMPFIIDCVRAYASVGEISDALRDVFGTYQEPALF